MQLIDFVMFGTGVAWGLIVALVLATIQDRRQRRTRLAGGYDPEPEAERDQPKKTSASA